MLRMPEAVWVLRRAFRYLGCDRIRWKARLFVESPMKWRISQGARFQRCAGCPRQFTTSTTTVHRMMPYCRPHLTIWGNNYGIEIPGTSQLQGLSLSRGAKRVTSCARSPADREPSLLVNTSVNSAARPLLMSGVPALHSAMNEGPPTSSFVLPVGTFNPAVTSSHDAVGGLQFGSHRRCPVSGSVVSIDTLTRLSGIPYTVTFLLLNIL
ncbi:hypothetical protein BCR34DRAFT_207762 [Clohesyomyces aquaticus]|uniref:Uncharacterized protein n=1 Tax=Clohesyomyces aquaticus TaxID=1231657 RepID=A0A1Y2A9S0_9PLEO|nr:hypothetical protein BCR34DRAFT_207762 [Clohesyomyces aquaticus]